MQFSSFAIYIYIYIYICVCVWFCNSCISKGAELEDGECKTSTCSPNFQDFDLHHFSQPGVISKKARKMTRTVILGIDDSEFSEYAFDCEYLSYEMQSCSVQL